jgi:hypothetical protein
MHGVIVDGAPLNGRRRIQAFDPPQPATRRRQIALALSLLAWSCATSACMNVQGSFEDLVWNPTASSFALADRHDLVVSRGTIVATRRVENDQTLTLFFSGAAAQPNDDWRRYSFSRLLDLRRDLSMNDALLIDGIPLEDVRAGERFEIEWTGNGRSTDGVFDAAMVTRPQLSASTSPIGERSKIVVNINDADAKAGGFISGTVEVTRARSDSQEDDVNTGIVTITFSVPVVAERRGKSNLAIARPILVCAAEKGPTRSAGCRDADPEPVVDASGLASSL